MHTDKLKVMTIVGTRPEIIRLSEIIRKNDKYFNHVLVHTGQNWDYTLNEIFFKDLDLRAPDHYLNSVGSNLGETIGNIIARSYTLLAAEQPDALLILGDTNSALSAMSAKRLKIPEEKFFLNIQEYANTSAASIPIALDELNRDGKLKRGDLILTIGFGGGLTYGANLIVW